MRRIIILIGESDLDIDNSDENGLNINNSDENGLNINNSDEIYLKY